MCSVFVPLAKDESNSTVIPMRVTNPPDIVPTGRLYDYTSQGDESPYTAFSTGSARTLPSIYHW
jgi:hypothetical protein